MHKKLVILSILLFTVVTANAASTLKLKSAKISGTEVKLGQGADIVQSRIDATKYISGSYGENSKGYYNYNGVTYIITFGPPSSGTVYIVKKIEKILK